MAIFASSLLVDVTVLISSLLALLYCYFKYQYSYWKRRGVPFIQPTFPCGNFKDVFLARQPLCDGMSDIYNALDGHQVGGFFQLHKPTLMIRDLDLVRSVLVKDFSNFQDRGMFYDEENDPLLNNLFLLGGPRWKLLRAKLTPTFTSGKMKIMFQTVLDCSVDLNGHVKSEAAREGVIEVRDIMARFTTDVIANCAFGIQCNCLRNPDAEFRLMGKKFLDRSLLGKIGILMMFFTPSLAKWTKLGNTPKTLTDFFVNVVKNTVDYREKNDVTRKDFMQLLIELKNKGCVDAEQMVDDSGDLAKFDINDVVGQAFAFFIAGFETSSSAMSFCLYELAVNPEIQSQLRQEIDAVLAKHDGRVTYEAVMEMEYLDHVLAETLRMYPPLAALNRECNTSHTLEDTGVTVEPGTMVVIPVYSLHHDPRYYPDPHKFIPDRFSKEEKAKRNAHAYLPFGEGPRNCIGMRFGLMQAKIGLLTLLRSYEFRVSTKTAVPMVLDPSSMVVAAKGGIYLQIVDRL